MNLKLKIDKYGNLINLDTNTIVVPSNELFTDNFWETDGTTWKVNTTTQVTASTSDTMSVVVPANEFTQNSRVDFYFRLHLPILDYDKKLISLSFLLELVAVMILAFINHQLLIITLFMLTEVDKHYLYYLQNL